jgi:hypothetical protein
MASIGHTQVKSRARKGKLGSSPEGSHARSVDERELYVIYQCRMTYREAVESRSYMQQVVLGQGVLWWLGHRNMNRLEWCSGLNSSPDRRQTPCIDCGMCMDTRTEPNHQRKMLSKTHVVPRYNFINATKITGPITDQSSLRIFLEFLRSA